MPRLQFTVTPELKEALDSESEQTGTPVSEILRRAAEFYFAERKQKQVASKVHWGRRKQDTDADTLPDDQPANRRTA